MYIGDCKGLCNDARIFAVNCELFVNYNRAMLHYPWTFFALIGFLACILIVV